MDCPVCGAADVQPPRCSTCRRPLLEGHDGDVVLSMTDVRQRYGTETAGVTALDGVSMDVRRGEVTLVVGPSGGGKTTALLVMGLLLRPTSGTVTIAGQAMHDASERDRTRVRLLRLGFVFQHFNLLKALTAVENVAVPARSAGVRKQHATARATRLLSDLGLAERMEHKPSDLSGGEQQRVAVARALSLGPDVVLADEPTANLDSSAGQRVVERFAEAARAQNCAVVIVTHDTRLEPIADRVLALEDGRLVEDRGNGGETVRVSPRPQPRATSGR